MIGTDGVELLSRRRGLNFECSSPRFDPIPIRLLASMARIGSIGWFRLDDARPETFARASLCQIDDGIDISLSQVPVFDYALGYF